MIAITVVLVGLLLFVVRRPQVWIGHEKIHQNSFSYAGQFSSLKACRSEVEKYGGYCSSRCKWVDNVPMGRVQTDGASQQAMNRNRCRTTAIGGNKSRSHPLKSASVMASDIKFPPQRSIYQNPELPQRASS